MLKLIISILSIVIGTIIKKLVEKYIQKHPASASNHNVIVRQSYENLGLICSVTFMIATKVVMFVCLV